MDNKTKILIVSPVVFVIILILIANFIHFEGELSGAEMQTLRFAPPEIVVKQRQKIQVSEELKSPIDFRTIGSVLGSVPPVPLDTLVPQAESGLSLTVISGKSRMAIIKGVVVKEGDTIDGIKINRIEPGRVLLKNKTIQWLYMEKIK